MDLIRAFFAVELPKEIRHTLAKLIRHLERQNRRANIRWLATDKLHITLQFLGNIRATDVPHLLDRVARELRSLSPFEAELGAVHLFPSIAKPRVVALEVKPAFKLIELAALIGRGVQACDYPIENRPFRAHLTIGRVGFRQPPLFSDVIVTEHKTFLISDVVLFQSELNAKGSIYTELGRVPLIL